MPTHAFAAIEVTARFSAGSQRQGGSHGGACMSIARLPDSREVRHGSRSRDTANACFFDVRKRPDTFYASAHNARMSLDARMCYRALKARDARFDGRFFVAVSSTHIYCRPVCTVRPPKRENCAFFPSAA